jgi:hypothetical protein
MTHPKRKEVVSGGVFVAAGGELLNESYDAYIDAT